MTKKDYYQVLGIEKNASADEIRRAFRKLAQQYHPDKGGDAEKFKEINEAYQVLSEPEKRKQYDQFGTTFEGFSGHGFSWEDIMRGGGFGGQGFGQGGFSEGFDFQDLGDIVGDMFGLGGRRKRGPARGANIEVEVVIDFRDAVFGTEQKLRLDRQVICDACKGNGAEPGSKLKKCPTCHGSGQVKRTQSILFGTFQSVTTCTNCHGSGQIPDVLCKKCAGSGSIQESKEVRIKIPAGIGDNQSIRLVGQGEAGQRSAPAGDLYVIVRVRPDKEFQREDDNILSRQEIAFPMAALGGKFKISTIDGPVELKIPAGTQSGTVFKLKGRGVPSLEGYGRGDHLVEIRVNIPQKLSLKESEIIQELGKVMGIDL